MNQSYITNGIKNKIKNMYFLKNLPALIIYSLTFYILMIPLSISLDFWIPSISISTSLGFICGFMNAKFKTTNEK